MTDIGVCGCCLQAVLRSVRGAFTCFAVLAATLLGTPAHASVDDLFTAAKMDNVSTVKSLLDQGYDKNAVETDGTSLLMEAVREKSGTVAKLLLQRHVDVNHRNNVHESAVMFASLSGDVDLVKAMLAAGAEINQSGWTALHYAAWGGHTEICRLLLAQGADIDAKSPNGTTPLMLAAREGHFDAVKLLLWEVAEPNARNEVGMTALSMAMRNRNTKIADLLRQAGARD